MDRVLTRLIGITMKNYIYAEISSQMENQLCEYVSFGGVLGIRKSYADELILNNFVPPQFILSF